MKASKKNIVVVDLSVKKTSPAGSCVLSELVGLLKTHDIHLFTNEIDDSLKDLIEYTLIDAPKAPLVLRYIVFSLRVKSRVQAILKQMPPGTIVQTTQGQFANSDISYPHFCHRAYLKKHWKHSTVTGARRVTRKLNHLYHSRMEAKAFKNVTVIVVPSHGLKREIVEFYPDCKNKIKVIANPVDVSHFNRPLDFNKSEARTALNIDPNDVVIAFAALGDFARKGLPELMGSLQEEGIKKGRFKILVIGGKPEEISKYKSQAREMGLEQNIIFVGFKKDIRSYLWMSDVFALPSLYEIFPLVCLQAAAAGLPLLVSPLHGVEEYIEHGSNGWLIERNPRSISKVLQGIERNDYNLLQMGAYALESVKQYDHVSFRQKWLEIFKTIAIK